ncbi:MAG: mechanosensitive ion channel [Candidatus Zixiibacteriota bacterium]|nr:MAG: mechanosensitive ion channel [candidate division Zixibacteria bacterium]
MDILIRLLENLRDLIPTGVAILGAILTLMIIRYIINRSSAGLPGKNYRRQAVTLLVSFIGLLVIILVLPITDSKRGQLLSLIGILLTAAIALSSTTLLGNIMAGLMLRAVRNFRPGDFIRVGEHFGRVSEQGLFHVEIQTEDRDLTTMPNLYLVTNPVKVIRASGTIITAEVSLGYNVPRSQVEDLLLKAAGAAGLQEPFVHITELGDFSITYRISGLLAEVKQILSSRSQLHAMMLDVLHRGGIEIVSPNFMNTRALSKEDAMIPKSAGMVSPPSGIAPAAKPEKLVFDKADQAESLEKLRLNHETLDREIEEIKNSMKHIDDAEEQEKQKARLNGMEERRKRLADAIRRREEQTGDSDSMT